MKKNAFAIAVALGTLVLFTAAALAQQGPPPNREEIAKRIELIRMWKLTEALDLDEEAAARFFPVLNEHESKIREVADTKRGIERELRKALNSETVSPKEDLIDLMQQIVNLDQTINELKLKEVEAVSKVLSQEQLVTFIRFNLEFQRRIRKMIHEMKPGRGKGGRHQMDTEQPGPPPDMGAPNR